MNESDGQSQKRSVLRGPGALRVCLAVLVALLLAGSGCASCGQAGLGLMPGVINDPANRSLRRAILAHGLSEFCTEMTSRSAPLALSPDAPAMGRFFPERCTTREVGDGDLFVEFSGRGYAYTNLSKKMSFSASGAVRYAQDFLMDGSTMYAYFRPRTVDSSDFRVIVVEQPVAAFFQSVGQYGDSIGQRLLGAKLAEGFTVIRESNGSTDFSLGIVERGKRPVRPFEIKGEGRSTIEHLTSEVQQNQRDFVGPIRIEGKRRALFLNATVDGIAAIDVLLLRGQDGHASRDLYLQYPQSGPLAGAPMFSDTMQAGVPYKRSIPVAEGTYYVVFDNTPSAGSVSPPMNPLDLRAATIRYALQVGEEP